MDYLQQLYAKLIGDWVGGGGGLTPSPRKIVAFGNVLLDRTAQLPDTELFEQFRLTLAAKGELDSETLAVVTAEACKRCVLTARFDRLKCTANLGGSALNTTRMLKHLGTETLFFGAVGEDQHAAHLRDMLQKQGVETRLETIADMPTGQCICLVHEGENSLYANIGASAKFSVDHLKRAQADAEQPFLRPIERKQILYVEGFFVPRREDVCRHIVHHFVRERRRLALNLSAPYIVNENFELVLQLAASAFFVFGNLSEFQALAKRMSCSSSEQVANKLLAEEQGTALKIILITKGADGVELITNYVAEHAPPGPLTVQSFNAPRVENVVDTTGAGDAFVAGFLHGWLEKRSLSECVRVATDVAARVVTQIGCNLPEATAPS